VEKVTKYDKQVGNESEPVFGYFDGDSDWVEVGFNDDEAVKAAAKALKASPELIKAIAFAMENHRDNVAIDLEDVMREIEDHDHPED
jgi:hypothetical protein